MQSKVLLPLLLATSFLGLSAHALGLREFKATMAREDSGPHNENFRKEFEALRKRFPQTKDPLVIDNREFLGSHSIVLSRSQDMATGPLLHSTEGLDLPASMFSTFGQELARTFRTRLELSAAAADVMAGLLEKQAVEMEGVSYSEYAQVIGRSQTEDLDVKKRELSQALDFLYSTSKIGALCDVPFIAGYAMEDERVIYIDRAVPEFKTFEKVDVPLHKLLNAHERVEKAILDEFGATYPHAHQVALRLEKAFAEAIGAPWRPYDAYWGPVSEETYDRHLTRVPSDLEMTPYLSFTDDASVAKVKEMRASYVGHQACFLD